MPARRLPTGYLLAFWLQTSSVTRLRPIVHSFPSLRTIAQVARRESRQEAVSPLQRITSYCQYDHRCSAKVSQGGSSGKISAIRNGVTSVFSSSSRKLQYRPSLFAI
ncbi:hypothetical protein DOTSEDRAFT_71778 [Dothistroma septosporum NZE10]|uniref:Uncharacterized protein n=1 Tax=Dothistroma septosporum (strain NZE10 / CBS 128990) TaxID=675120 RepID=N1PL79_DOTSN|nr:hypothetical protein DOTSEDRAFT_71778 [Dothistroma septosporum NZE10]